MHIRSLAYLLTFALPLSFTCRQRVRLRQFPAAGAARSSYPRQIGGCPKSPRGHRSKEADGELAYSITKEIYALTAISLACHLGTTEPSRQMAAKAPDVAAIFSTCTSRPSTRKYEATQNKKQTQLAGGDSYWYLATRQSAIKIGCDDMYVPPRCPTASAWMFSFRGFLISRGTHHLQFATPYISGSPISLPF